MTIRRVPLKSAVFGRLQCLHVPGAGALKSRPGPRDFIGAGWHGNAPGLHPLPRIHHSLKEIDRDGPLRTHTESYPKNKPAPRSPAGLAFEHQNVERGKGLPAAAATAAAAVSATTTAPAVAAATATAAAATTTTAAAPAAAAAATAAAAEAAATTTATATLLARAGFVDDEGAAAHVGAVHRGDGLAGLFIVGHLDEAEAAGAAGLAVDDDLGTVDLPVLGEQLGEVLLGGAVRKIADVNVHDCLPRPRPVSNQNFHPLT